MLTTGTKVKTDTGFVGVICAIGVRGWIAVRAANGDIIKLEGAGAAYRVEKV